MLNSGEGEKIKKLLAIDGKTQRGNGNKNQKANHIVSAVTENGFCLGEKRVSEKTNEITAIPEFAQYDYKKRRGISTSGPFNVWRVHSSCPGLSGSVNPHHKPHNKFVVDVAEIQHIIIILCECGYGAHAYAMPNLICCR